MDPQGRGGRGGRLGFGGIVGADAPLTGTPGILCLNGGGGDSVVVLLLFSNCSTSELTCLSFFLMSSELHDSSRRNCRLVLITGAPLPSPSPTPSTIPSLSLARSILR